MPNTSNYSSILSRFSLLIIFVFLLCLPCISRADEPMPKGHYELTGVEVVAINRVKRDGKTIDEPSDKLTYWIRFDIKTKSQKVVDSEDKPYKVLNPTVREKTKLTLDKPIKINGKDIPAGTNLLKYQVFDGKRLNVSMSQLSPLTTGSVRILYDFAIPADTYTVTFEWETEFGQKFTNQVKVHIDVAL